MLHILRFFSSRCRLFHNAIFFGFCNIHILNTGCAKISPASWLLTVILHCSLPWWQKQQFSPKCSSLFAKYTASYPKIFPHISRSLKICNCVHKTQRLKPLLAQLNQIITLRSIVILSCFIRIESGVLPSSFPINFFFLQILLLSYPSHIPLISVGSMNVDLASSGDPVFVLSVECWIFFRNLFIQLLVFILTHRIVCWDVFIQNHRILNFVKKTMIFDIVWTLYHFSDISAIQQDTQYLMINFIHNIQ